MLGWLTDAADADDLQTQINPSRKHQATPEGCPAPKRAKLLALNTSEPRHDTSEHAHRIKFMCTHCLEDLSGLDTKVCRIRHIMVCGKRLSSASAPPAHLVAAPIPLAVMPETPLAVVPKTQADTLPSRAVATPGPASHMVAASDDDCFRVLMQSARTMWARRTEPPPPPPPPPPRDALQVLMQAAAAAGSANKASVAASASAEAGCSRGRGSRGRGAGWQGGGGGGGRARIVPPFKRIEGTPFVVDGFAWGAQSSDVHFLTHFHADHYKGITKRWGAPIYASAVTAALVVRRLGVAPSQMIVLPMDVPSEVCGARVTPIDANHCPGAVLLLFELSGGRIVLHTGDFRYTPSMLANPALRALRRPIDMLYLDTTYCDPKHRFPTQAAVVQAVVDRCKLLLDAPRTLILFGSYSIGKERVFLEVGKQCGVRIGVERAKERLLECCALAPEYAAVLTSDVASTRWRVVPMCHLKADRLKALLRASGGRFTGCVAFRPTGWCFGRGGASAGAAGRTVRLSQDVTICEVAYSEHSSFDELRDCVQTLRPRRIVSTVDGGWRGDKHAGVPLLLA